MSILYQNRCLIDFCKTEFLQNYRFLTTKYPFNLWICFVNLRRLFFSKKRVFNDNIEAYFHTKVIDIKRRIS